MSNQSPTLGFRVRSYILSDAHSEQKTCMKGILSTKSVSKASIISVALSNGIFASSIAFAKKTIFINFF